MYIQPKVTVDIATVQSPGIVKPDGNTITIDNNGTITSSIDLTDYIEKSSTEGLVLNDGTIDTSEYVTLNDRFVEKAWNYTPSDGGYIWTDGTDTYYSNGGVHKVLDKATSTWNDKTWTGLNSVTRGFWTDGTYMYYSNGSSQKVLTPGTTTWTDKTWSGMTNFDGVYIWTDGTDIYYSMNSTQKVLNVSTSTWSDMTWTTPPSTGFYGSQIWTEGNNIYLSFGTQQKVLNKATHTWSDKTWNGFSALMGVNVWTDGKHIYYSSNDNQKVLDVATSTWSDIEWENLVPLLGQYIWTDGSTYYYSRRYEGQDTQYELIPNVLDQKQDKFLSTPITVSGVSRTTVEDALIAIASQVAYMETTVTLSTSTTTTATFINAAITTNSCVEVGVSEWGLVPDNVTVTTGVCTVIFPTVDSAHTVTVRLYVR